MFMFSLFTLFLAFVIGWYAVASVVTFLAYGYDKRRALVAAWRLKEQTLHTLEMLGGWPGALVAQRVFKHKRRKTTYMAAFWRIVAIHVGVWFLVVLIRFG